MAEMKPGTRLKSVVCSGEAMAIASPLQTTLFNLVPGFISAMLRIPLAKAVNNK